MTLDQLRVFVTVAALGHMTRAAETLHLTQSAVSAAIAALEARHGVPLFDRIGRGIVLSPAGRSFLPEARAVLARADAAAEFLSEIAGLARGAIRVFASQTVGSYWLPPRLTSFRERFPGIAVDVELGNTAQVAQALLEGACEIGFVEGEIRDERLAPIEIGADHLAIVCRPGSPLAGRSASIEDLARVDWILRERGSGTRAALENALLSRGLDPARLKVAIDLPSNEAVLSAIAASDLHGAVSEFAAGPLLATGVLARVAFDLPARPFHAVHHRERLPSHAAAAFLRHVQAKDANGSG